MLYNSLTNEAESELEHENISNIYCKNSIAFVLGKLKAAFQPKSVCVKRRYLHQFWIGAG